MKAKTYSELKKDLDEVLGKIQNPDLNLDEALKLHESARTIIKQLEQYLEKAKKTIKESTN